jgi:hypothetical protein
MKCWNCGKEFEPKRKGQFLCGDPECVRERRKYISKQYNKRNRAKNCVRRRERKYVVDRMAGEPNGLFCQKCGRPLYGNWKRLCISCKGKRDNNFRHHNLEGEFLYWDSPKRREFPKASQGCH